MVKTRFFPDSNYAAIFDGKQTYRLEVDGDIQKPPYPEFYDIALNNLCFAACEFCYASATKNGRNFDNVLSKIVNYFGPMTANERPFQVALGGHGEPTLHPDFIEVLKTFREFDIVPNYTTNGMHLSRKILDATKEYAGGVAVSAHSHLPWSDAVRKLAEYTEVHLHYIISDINSAYEFLDTYEDFNELITTFVLLPYQAIGRAPKVHTDFRLILDLLEDKQLPNIAYGAYFYDLLKDRPALNVSLYEPHMFSRYLMLDDPVTEYRSSFDVN